MDKKTITIIKDYFASQFLVRLVYLYVWQARDEATADSDIDLAILADEKEPADSSRLQLQAMNDLSRLISEKIEVQNLNICKSSFAYRVIAEGKIIYARSEAERVEFEEIVMRQYFDLKPILDEYAYNLAERARKGILKVHRRY